MLIPEGLILLSGFTSGDQNPLDMAGCYIRLGNNLRSFGLNDLAASSFLNSGVIYAQNALQAEEEQRVDFLTSAAQNYYWAYCNESLTPRKNLLSGIVVQYFARANTDTSLLNATERSIWLTKIAREEAIFLAHT